ncbi:MAG: YitT family protein [Bacteroidaceae bacterium]|nr:YitT family protein [Bacteroidaceae bacterium]
MTKSYVLHELKDYALISVGVILYAIGVTVFMLPYSLTTGGVAGISSIIYYVTGIEVQVTYVIINAILLIVAVKDLGIRFCIKTIYAVFFMTFVLWLMQRLIEVPDPAHSGEMMLPQLIGEESFMACVLGAILCGTGVALCFENNGSTGGTDIIAAIVNKYKNMSLGSVIMACDVVIISSCYFIFHDWFRVIYGFVMLFICSATIDYWMRRRHQSVQFMIFSRNADAIADAIVNTHHGVTVLDGEGWFTHTDRKVIVSIIRRREQAMIQRMVKSIDPYAFVSMTDASGVWGEGFDQIKVSDKKKRADKNKKNAVLVCVTNNNTKIDTAQQVLGDYYDIRSLLQVGCDTRKEFYSVILGQEPRKRVSFVKKFFGFDAFYLSKDGSVTLVQGNYDQAEYDITQHKNLEEMKAYLEGKKKTKP